MQHSLTYRPMNNNNFHLKRNRITMDNKFHFNHHSNPRSLHFHDNQ